MSVHTANLKWHTGSNGESYITDSGQTIARFYPGSSILPENPHRALRPISLHDLRLIPGEPPMIEEGEVCGPLCLSWRKHLIFNMEIEELKIDDSNPETFKLYVKTHDTGFRKDQPEYKKYQPDNVSEETWLELSYDRQLKSYVYDIRTRLRVQPGREDFVLANELRGLEFGDILPAGENDFFPPRGNKKYTHIVYKCEDGQLYQRPQNKHFGPDKTDVLYSPDGFAAFVDKVDSNPLIEFLDGSGSMVRSEICWAMYDLHLKCRADISAELLRDGKPLDIHYRLYSISQEKAADLLKQAKPDPVLEHPLVQCPTFDEQGINLFSPTNKYRSPSDKWFWMCSDEKCRWDRTFGFKTEGSLVIERDKIIHSASCSDAPWVKCFAPFSEEKSSQWAYNKLPGNMNYKIKAMVRTKGVLGKVYIAVRYISGFGLTEASSPILKTSPKKLSGDNEWTEITLVVKHPAENKPANATLFLVLEGEGKCWFDEVEILSFYES